ncbi:MAG: DUF2007 domain-containing protein [Kofleriaceae bacterium]|nr:DUF2007 domain-containing protein [Kofleriaceae bacterium]
MEACLLIGIPLLSSAALNLVIPIDSVRLKLQNQPEKPMPKTSDRDFVKLCSARDSAEASFLRSYLESEGITVYIQGENHRSMLGMVGAFIELNVLVASSDYEEANAMMQAFGEAQPDDEGGLEGPYRDDFSEEDEEDDDELQAAIEKRTKEVQNMAILVPFGGAHFAAGAPVRGLVLAGLSALGIAGILTGGSALSLLLVLTSILMDRSTVKPVVIRSVRKSRRLAKQAGSHRNGAG